MTEVSSFPKTYRMIEFVNKQIKEESKKFNCKPIVTKACN